MHVHSLRDCFCEDDDDDDAMQRGIDLIFIISLTFRRGKLGLVCASLMLPITSSLLKPFERIPKETARTRTRRTSRGADHPD